MQILTHEPTVRLFLQDFARSLHRDAFCWKDWYCLHIMPDISKSDRLLDDTSQLYVAKIIRSLLPGNDGSIVCLRHGGLLVIYRQNESISLESFLITLNHSTNIHVPPLVSASYAMEVDVPAFLDMLETYTGPISLSVPLPAESDQKLLKMLVPHLNDFLDAWLTICEARKGRTQPHIMVVDDDPVTTRIISRALKEEYPIVTAHNAAEAIERHLLFVPDLVFLDIGLPDSDGFTVLEHIRAHDPECTVVMFTGNSFLDYRVKAMSSGANGFLPKPFKREHFEHYINDWKAEHVSLS